MDCKNQVVIAPEIERELDGEFRRLMKQYGLSAADLLQSMVALYKQKTMVLEPDSVAALQEMETLVKKFDDQCPDNNYVPVTVLLQQTQAEVIISAKKFLNTLSPGSFPSLKPPKVHGMFGY